MSAPTERRWWDTLLLGVWAGAVGGLLEAVVRVSRKLLGGPEIHLGAYVAWMPAVSCIVLLGALALLLAPLAAVWPRVFRTGLLFGLFFSLAALNAIWRFTPPLELYAVVVLSLGVGIQLARMLAPRQAACFRLIRWTTPVLLLLILGIGGGIEWQRARLERAGLLAQPAADRNRPNVLLLVLDTVRSMNLSAYGYFRETTPTLARLGTEGARFEHAVSAAPWTLPSHAAMFTGRWLHEQSTGWKEPLDGHWPTLAEALTAAGYATGGFVANVDYCDREYGLARGFLHYEDYQVTWRQVLRSSAIGLWVTRQPVMDRRFGPRQMWTRKTATTVTDDFLAWQAERGGTRPWFAFLNFFDAHRDYYAPRRYRSLFVGDSAAAPPVPRRPVPGEVERRYRPQPIVEYDRAIRYIDDEIGRMLVELERRGQLENTLVIVTSDHGEEFEEHALTGHGNSLYYPAISVPLVLRWPAKVTPGTRVPSAVSTRDLPATIMELAGLPTGPFPGGSLARYWEPGRLPLVPDTVLAELHFAWGKPAWYPVSKGNMKSAIAGGDHLIRNGDGGQELFDVSADRWEQDDLVGDSARARPKAALGAALDRIPAPPPPRHGGEIAPDGNGQ